MFHIVGIKTIFTILISIINKMVRTSLILFCACISIGMVLTTYPVVILHGIGDSCSGGYMKSFPKKVNKIFGASSTCIQFGGGTAYFST